MENLFDSAASTSRDDMGSTEDDEVKSADPSVSSTDDADHVSQGARDDQSFIFLQGALEA
ncbi:hypothetical protein A0H81_00312 [Grifola frondosa]|uniref:Uncharacterized protein n=1 Tax=Grifola frondosa TaxID=5627 RepID=A0A1C7MSX4_GRIFR|nr:hypothetical protein A0H81_00312 [Grifola frondosa]